MAAWTSAAVVFSLGVPGTGGDDDQGAPDPLAVAFDEFCAAPIEIQQAVVDQFRKVLARSPHEDVQRVRALISRAQRELKVVPTEPLHFHDPREYAPTQPLRTFLDPDSRSVLNRVAEMYRYGSESLCIGRVHYDFARNVATEAAAELAPADVLWNCFNGYQPGSDVLLAWLEHQFDHRDDLDAISQHFSFAYATLDGRVYPSISLYDAFSSFSGVDMPDVDVISFARNILDNHSYQSPIPPGAHQQELYNQVHEGFLRYYRHRTFIEYVANLYLNPEAPIGYDHEAIRDRVLYSFHLDELDPRLIRKRLIETNSRGGFVAQVDRLSKDDPSWRWYARDASAQINGVRWKIANASYDVLREFGFLREPESGSIAALPEEEMAGDD